MVTNPSKKTFDATQVQAAYELLGWGHITPGTAAALHQSGVRGGTYNGKPIVVAPAPQPVNLQQPFTNVLKGIGNLS